MRVKFLATLLLSVILAGGCKKRQSTPRPTVPHIPVFTIRTDSLATPMEFVGEMNSNSDVIIQPRITGYLLSAHFKSGMPVHKGQLLYRIDPAQLQTQEAAARSQLSSAQAQLIEAQNNYERAVPLARINAVSRSALDQYKAQYESARAAVRSAEASLHDASLNVGYATIYSPIDGIIGATDPSVGDLVGVGTQYTTLTTISNTDSVSVTLSIPVSEYLRLRDSTKLDEPSYVNRNLLSNIRLWLSDGSLYPYPGVYSYTRRATGDRMGTIELVVKFPNPEQVLKPGEYARVMTDAGKIRPRTVVPQICVSQNQGINSLWVIRPDSTAEYRRVELGKTYGSYWIINQGVEIGEWVAESGLQKMRNGMKVIPVASASETDRPTKPAER